jgi:hypothetical protein
VQTAHNDKTLLDYVEIIHPFHPLKGQRFEVLKRGPIAGKETLTLKDSAGETFSVQKDWTDCSELAQMPLPQVFLKFDCLLEIAKMIEKLKSLNQ